MMPTEDASAAPRRDTATEGTDGFLNVQTESLEKPAVNDDESGVTSGNVSAGARDVAVDGTGDTTRTAVLPPNPFGPEEWELVALVTIPVAGTTHRDRLTIHLNEDVRDESAPLVSRRPAAPAVLPRRVRFKTIEPGRHSAGEPRLHVCVRRAAFEKLRRTVGSRPPERGGIFVGTNPFLIEDFIFDRTSNPDGAVYYPNTKYLNGVLARDHEPHGRYFVGLAHSHPPGMWRPSGDENWGDVKAARNNLLAADNAHLQALFIPIIESAAATGSFDIHAFVMTREDLKVHPANYEIIEGGDAC
jgi:hypothetical protein